MRKPNAYDPQPGQMYQIFCREGNRGPWEACDYATSSSEKRYLISEYQTAYGPDWNFKSIVQPLKFWPAESLVYKF